MEKLNNYFAEKYSLSIEYQKIFFSIFKKMSYQKKDVIIKSGKINNHMYLLLEGIVRAYIIDNNGREIIRTIKTPISGFTSLPSVTLQKPSVSSFDCLTDTVVLKANYHDFIKLTKKHHQIALFYNQVLINEFNEVENRFNMLATLNATERYLELKKNTPNIEQLISLKQIAAYLNITSIQFSRIRKKLYSN